MRKYFLCVSLSLSLSLCALPPHPIESTKNIINTIQIRRTGTRTLRSEKTTHECGGQEINTEFSQAMEKCKEIIRLCRGCTGSHSTTEDSKRFGLLESTLRDSISRSYSCHTHWYSSSKNSRCNRIRRKFAQTTRQTGRSQG